MQARYPLISRVGSSKSDATNGTATQAGGPNRFLLQANYTGATVPEYKSACVHMHEHTGLFVCKHISRQPAAMLVCMNMQICNHVCMRTQAHV